MKVFKVSIGNVELGTEETLVPREFAIKIGNTEKSLLEKEELVQQLQDQLLTQEQESKAKFTQQKTESHETLAREQQELIENFKNQFEASQSTSEQLRGDCQLLHLC